MQRKRFCLHTILVAVAACWATLGTVGAYGQTVMVNTLGLSSVNDLLGTDVVDRQGTKLAHVGGILLENDKIGYLIAYVAEEGGMWRQVPIPASVVELGIFSHNVIVDIEKRRLSRAPACNDSENADFLDLDWEQKIHTYYGERPPERVRESYMLIRR